MAASEIVANEAFVTLATNDTYSLGALVLAESLRRAGTTRKLAILITPRVSNGIRQQLSEVFDEVKLVDVLDSRDSGNLDLLGRPDLGQTFTKLHCWRLTQYSKCVFMDADTLVLQNIDELFDREELSAAPDAGWPDCFNSGVFVFRPSDETYQALLQFAISHGSFDGGDQGLLNLFFSDWATKDIKRHLPFIYNVVAQAFYSYLPAFRQYGKNVKVVHFIGAFKPWHASFNTATGKVESNADTIHHQAYLQMWWDLFMDRVNPKLDPEVTSLIQLVQPPTTPAPQPLTNQNPIPSHVTTPYIPPDLPIFYDQLRSSQDSPPTVVEIQSGDRSYGHFESFYSEPPMGGVEDYPMTAEVYSSKELQISLEQYSHDIDNQAAQAQADNEVYQEHQEAPDENGNLKTITSESISDSGNIVDQSRENTKQSDYDVGESRDHLPANREEALTGQSEESSVDQSEHPQLSGQSEESSVDQSQHTQLTGQSEESSVDQSEDTSTTLMGLVGELSSLRIGGANYSKEQLQDRERQYKWEEGQVDYLGMDSFTHIQKHLDDVVSGKTKVESAGPISVEIKKPAAPAAANVAAPKKK